MAGSSGCGKSSLMLAIVKAGLECMTRLPRRIILFHAHAQGAYEELKAVAPCPVKTVLGGPSEDLVTQPGSLLIIDDLQGTHSHVIREWFTRKSHHFDTSIAYLVQNVFDKTVHHRTISLNSTYIILFKNPRDTSQVMHLDKQVCPNSNGRLTRAYKDVTKGKPHAYILIDFNQSTPDEFLICSTLFQQRDFPNAYAYPT